MNSAFFTVMVLCGGKVIGISGVLILIEYVAGAVKRILALSLDLVIPVIC